MFNKWQLQLFPIVIVTVLFLQLKIDEFESSVNEVKDPYPSADFPGEGPGALGGICWGGFLLGGNLLCVPCLDSSVRRSGHRMSLCT